MGYKYVLNVGDQVFGDIICMLPNGYTRMRVVDTNGLACWITVKNAEGDIGLVQTEKCKTRYQCVQRTHVFHMDRDGNRASWQVKVGQNVAGILECTAPCGDRLMMLNGDLHEVDDSQESFWIYIHREGRVFLQPKFG